MIEIAKDKFACKLCIDENTPFHATTDLSDFVSQSNKPKFDCDVCLDPEYLNNLFTPSSSEDNESETFHETDCGFKPIPAKYFSPKDIDSEFPLNSRESNTNDILSNKFSSIGINIRSLTNTKNFAKLEIFMKSLCFKPSAIALNETYLRDNEPGPHSNLDGYHFISNCRNTHKGAELGYMF